MTTIKSIALYCTEGSSDKEYHVSIEQIDGGYLVNTLHGRRGSALRPGTKTKAPVDLAKAEKTYATLVKSKMSGGYTEAESGARYVGTDLEERDSGLKPMLPSPINRAQLQELHADTDWAFQEKHDGENRIVILENGTVTGVNRRGLFCSIREEWTAGNIAGRTVIAGEDMGDHLVAFDILMVDGNDLSDLNLIERHEELCATVSGYDWIRISPLAVSAQDKLAMLARIENSQGEGVIAKRIAAAYEGGRSNDHLKFKYEESATFEVIRINDQRSVGLGLYDGDDLVDLGNVTVPANHDVPSPGNLVEVSFMNRYENGGLEQPKYKGIRTDLEGKPELGQITRVKAKKAA